MENVKAIIQELMDNTKAFRAMTKDMQWLATVIGVENFLVQHFCPFRWKPFIGNCSRRHDHTNIGQDEIFRFHEDDTYVLRSDYLEVVDRRVHVSK